QSRFRLLHSGAALALLMSLGCNSHDDGAKDSTQTDLKVLKAQRDREEVAQLAKDYPDAKITSDESLDDALRAALKVTAAKLPQSRPPSTGSGSQAERLLHSNP